MFSKLKLVVVLTIVALTAACVQGGTLDQPQPMRYIQTADGCVVGGGTVGTSADASFTYAGKYCRDAHGQWREMNADGTFGPTVAGQALVAIAGTVPAAIVQGAFGVAIADRHQGRGGPQVVNQNLVSSTANANQATGVEVDVSVTGTLPCVTQGTCPGLGH